VWQAGELCCRGGSLAAPEVSGGAGGGDLCVGPRVWVPVSARGRELGSLLSGEWNWRRCFSLHPQ